MKWVWLEEESPREHNLEAYLVLGFLAICFLATMKSAALL